MAELVSGLSLGSHSDSETFLVACVMVSQDGLWEFGRTHGLGPPLSFGSFLNSSGWRWLVNSTFLTGTSCRKVTHARGYYGAQASRFSVSPNNGMLAHMMHFLLATSSPRTGLCWVPGSVLGARVVAGDMGKAQSSQEN